MSKILVSALYAGVLFVGTLVCLRIGWRLGHKRLKAEGENAHAGLGAVEGGIFGLMGLLIAFTFTGAASRFNERRELITQQVNAIGTAWLRLDLLDAGTRTEMRELFRGYVDAQLELSRVSANPEAAEAVATRFSTLQGRIWEKAIGAVKTGVSQPLAQALLPPINEMFDLAESRGLARRQHTPRSIFLMLGLLVFISALMAGFGMAKANRQSLLHVLGFATVMALSVYFILDLEFPRLGLVRVDDFDLALVELRDSMN
jgi:hypothetical protein